MFDHKFLPSSTGLCRPTRQVAAEPKRYEIRNLGALMFHSLVGLNCGNTYIFSAAPGKLPHLTNIRLGLLPIVIMPVVRSRFLRASRITYSKLSLAVNTPTFGQKRKFSKAIAEELAYTAALPKRPFWRLRRTEKIEVELKESRHKNWGFIFYRCTYEDDDVWIRFTEIVR
jgi:hypothetical protein